MRWLLSSIAALSLAVPVAQAPGAAVATGPVCRSGTAPYQRELERELRLPVDGRQSTADCVAIRRLQQRLGIRPADGRATLRTYRLVVADRIRRNPAARRACPVRPYRVTCVDLNRQILWAQSGKRLVFDPVPIRSGRDGLETRLGWQRIYWKSRDHYSTIYHVAMPYAQFFNGGQALHGTRSDLFSSGSAGCVNMAMSDAARLYDLLMKGDRLYLWGTKPGTDG
ncbi:L,D-transpeptidase [Streptomyces sp. NPDC046465]|uniref:L,D-transpeptidase n=1 Tax=Streptomyces sp. NPDC046465 TaxID=3155810 RepID=UPI0033DCFECA